MAKAMSGCGAPTTIGTPQYNFLDMTVSKGFEYLGCGTDDLTTRTLTGAVLKGDDMTNEKCVDYCVSKGFTIAGTEWARECYCGNSIPTGRGPVPGLMGDCSMPCTGDNKEICGGQRTLALYQKCGTTCQNVVYTVNNSSSPSGAAGFTLPSGTGAASADAISSTAAPSMPTSSEARVSLGSTSTKSTDGNDHLVVITKTRSVIPLPAQSSCGGVVTVTVALTTVTVTANIPETLSPMAAYTTAPDSPAPVLTTTSESAPYTYSNGTSFHHHHHSGTGWHSYIKAHATPARRH
jgi:hypothetical protein